LSTKLLRRGRSPADGAKGEWLVTDGGAETPPLEMGPAKAIEPVMMARKGTSCVEGAAFEVALINNIKMH